MHISKNTPPKDNHETIINSINLLFFGSLLPKGSEKKLLERTISNHQVASNTLQWNLVQGLEAVMAHPIKIITIPNVGDYPKYHMDIIIKGEEFLEAGRKNYSVGYFNLKIANIATKYIQFNRVIRQVFKEFEKKSTTMIFVYAPFAHLLLPAISSKRKHGNTKICLIMPDLPGMMGGDDSKIHIKIYKYLNQLIMDWIYKHVDYFVFLTEHMPEKVPTGNRPWCVVEGISNDVGRQAERSNLTEIISILYTGTLDKRYGITDLLEAFSLLEGEKYQLWICGSGEATSDCKAHANRDSRVKFFGQKPRSEILNLQAMATLLINPRTSSGEYTKYSFPSKTMEYFMSGTPCIMHKLPGIPQEYFEYCITLDSEGPQGIRDAIIRAELMGPLALRKMGERACEFVSTNKNSIAQCKKIIDMIFGKKI